MANKKFYFLSFIIFFNFFINNIKCQEEEMSKNSKVLGCISLARGAMKNEQDSIAEIANAIDASGSKKLSSKILTLMIVKCYRKITTEKAITVLKAMHHSDNQWKPEYRDMIGLNSNIMEDIETDDFEQDFKEVNAILQELNNEARNMADEKESSSSDSKPKKQQQQSNQKSRQQSKPNNNRYNNEPSMIANLFKPLVNIIQSISSIVGFDSFFGVAMSILMVYLFSCSVKFLFTGGRPERRNKKNRKNETEN